MRAGAAGGLRLAGVAGVALALAAIGCGGSAPRRVDQDDVSRQEALEETRLAERQREEWTPPVLLWELGHGASASVLLAAMPYGTTMRHALPDPHGGRLELAERVVVAVDPRAMRMEEAGEASMMPGRRDRLDRILDRELWAAVRAAFEPAIADETLRRTEPFWLAQHLLRVRMAEIEAAADGRAPVAFAASTSSVIGDVLAWATTQGVPVVALEEPAAARARAAAIPREASIDGLRAVVVDAARVRESLAAQRTAYLAADDRALAAACADDAGAAQYGEAFRAWDAELLDRWVPVLRAQIEQGDAFVVAPACTAVGANGVLARLAAEGVPVRRLGAPPGSAPPRDLGRAREAGVLP